MAERSLPTTANRLSRLREYGWEERYISKSVGINRRLDEIQAAILRVKLRHLDEDNSRRISRARLYTEALTDEERMTLPKTANEATHVFHQYVIRVAEARLFAKLPAQLRHRYTGSLMSVHQQPAYGRPF